MLRWQVTKRKQKMNLKFILRESRSRNQKSLCKTFFRSSNQLVRSLEIECPKCLLAAFLSALCCEFLCSSYAASSEAKIHTQLFKIESTPDKKSAFSAGSHTLCGRLVASSVASPVASAVHLSSSPPDMYVYKKRVSALYNAWLPTRTSGRTSGETSGSFMNHGVNRGDRQ